MKPRVQAIAIPPDALLARYAADPGYTDCYAVDLPRVVDLAAYVEAFYTGGVFRIERWLLRWLLGRPFLLGALLLIAAAVPRDARASWYRQCLYSGTLVSAPTRIIDRTSGKRRMEFRFHVRDGVALAGTADPGECTSLSGREIRVRMSPRILSTKPRVGEVRHLRYYCFEDMCDIGGGACYEEDYKFVTASEAKRLVVPAPSKP